MEVDLASKAFENVRDSHRTVSWRRFIVDFANGYFVRYCGILAAFFALLPVVEADERPTEFLLNNLHDLVNVGLFG